MPANNNNNSNALPIIKVEPKQEEVTMDTAPVIMEVKRRAINLEDYKKLRSGGKNGVVIKNENKTTGNQSSLVKPTIMQVINTVDVETTIVNPNDTVHPSTTTCGPDKYLDPISEAKNKALRMQERRKAARMKQDEIQLKTPLVPILPLAVMTGLISEETYLAELNAKEKKTIKGDGKDQKSKAPFDEIQIVSVGCNTKLTIRPDYESATLLSNLSSQIGNKNPLTSNSLLFSIQDVVIKKTTETDFVELNEGKSPDSVSSAAQYSPGKPEGANEGTAVVNNDHTGYHHGEDKVIMHLRKDRIRPRTVSIVCQTDSTPEFPELQLLAPAIKKGKRKVQAHIRRRSLSNSSHVSRSSGSEDSESDYSDRDRSRSPSGGSEYNSASEDEYGRSEKRRRLYSNKSQYSRSRSRSRSPSGDDRESRAREQSRFRSRSPRHNVWGRSRSRSRSNSVVSGRPNNNGRNNINRNGNNNKNNNRWNRQKNQSPGGCSLFRDEDDMVMDRGINKVYLFALQRRDESCTWVAWRTN